MRALICVIEKMFKWLFGVSDDVDGVVCVIGDIDILFCDE